MRNSHSRPDEPRYSREIRTSGFECHSNNIPAGGATPNSGHGPVSDAFAESWSTSSSADSVRPSDVTRWGMIKSWVDAPEPTRFHARVALRGPPAPHGARDGGRRPRARPRRRGSARAGGSDGAGGQKPRPQRWLHCRIDGRPGHGDRPVNDRPVGHRSDSCRSEGVLMVRGRVAVE